MGKNKKEKQKRQSAMGQVRKAHQKLGGSNGKYVLQLMGAFYRDFFIMYGTL
ncbi:hypothetical protein C823_003772 [Eubacterium plexicaudatum ASF492]|nr:hypothetical protein C823_003772 [Eubacterium plexicaudatum ASF492]